MTRPNITLGGVTVLALGVQGWRFTTGTQPNVQSFLIHEKDWGSMEQQLGKEVTLRIGSYATIQGLIPYEETPTTKPYHRAVLVADLRLWWQRKIVLRNYNIRRRQNSMRLVGPDLVQLKVPVSQYAFFPASMDDKDPWHAKTHIKDVLEAVHSKSVEIDSIPTVDSKQVSSETGSGVQGRVTLNDVRLRDPGDQAVARALLSAPGASVWVDAMGTARVFDTTDLQDTENLLQAVGPETVAGGMLRRIDRRAIRPKEVHVYFEREIEMLSRAREEGTSPDLYANQDAPSEADLWNVAPVPDPTLHNTNTDTDMTMGTWAVIQDLIDSWDAERQDSDDPEAMLPWSIENLRKLWLNSQAEAVWGDKGDLLASGSGPRRIGTLRTHWRQTYMIDPLIMQRMESVAPIRLAILDDITRTRAPASVFATYCVVFTAKGVYLAARRKDVDTVQYENVDAYPDLDGGEKWDDKEGVASATLQLLDRELGIFRINFTGDAFGRIGGSIPGYLVEDTDSADPEANAAAPFRALRFQNKRLCFLGGRVRGAPGAVLHAGYRAAFIYSGVQGAPNNKNRFTKVVVKASDVKEEMRQEFNVDEGDGPAYELYAPANLITARWGLVPTDFEMSKYTEALNKLLGIVEDPKEEEEDDGDPVEKPPDPWGLLNEGHLRSWAVAEAVKVYAAYADRTEGRPAPHMSTLPNDIRLRGSVESLSYEAEATGRLVGRITLAGPTFNLNPVALVPQWARPQILGVVLDRAKP